MLNNRRNLLKKALIASLLVLSPLSLQIAHAADPEKVELKLGFIKLTDMAPLAIAYEKGFFEDEGLYVAQHTYWLEEIKKAVAAEQAQA